jgi:hypothetical protein
VLVSGCSDEARPAASPSADAGNDATLAPVSGPREVDATLTFDANGISNVVEVTIPEKTRSVTVVVEGETTRLYGLASFVMSDGVDLVGIDVASSHASAMRESYFDEQVGAMPGSLDQSIRLGTFTHVYPYAPGQTLVSGAATIRIATDGAEGTAKVKVLMPEDDGARILHLNVTRVSETATMSAPPPFLEELRTIFAQAEIDVVVDEVVTLPGTAFAKLTTFTEPQEAPDSDAAKLALVTGPKTKSTALDVMIVDDLPSGVAGLSLGVPGPPIATSYYYGVVIEEADATSLGRVVAHEVAHFLGLQHVTNQGVSGTVYADPLDDTSPTAPNLMTKGTELTPGQVFVLKRSALLTK